MKVKAPNGTVWRVRRHWVARPRWRGPIPSDAQRRRKEPRGPGPVNRVLDWIDMVFIAAMDWPIALVIVAIVAIVIVVVAVTVPFVLFLLETAWLAIALFVGLVGRVVFRRPWVVEAAREGEAKRYEVVGWRNSGRVMEQLRDAIAREGTLPERVTPQQR